MLDYQGFAGSQTKYQGVRKSSSLAVRVRCPTIERSPISKRRTQFLQNIIALKIQRVNFLSCLSDGLSSL